MMDVDGRELRMRCGGVGMSMVGDLDVRRDGQDFYVTSSYFRDIKKSGNTRIIKP